MLKSIVRKIVHRFREDAPVPDKPKKQKMAVASPVAEDILRLDYPRLEIFIKASSPMERKWRANSCAKEPWTVAWIEKSLEKGDVLYDIGANVGTFTLLAAKLLEGLGGGKVLAFEPGYASFARLCENIVLNGCGETVVPVPVPLSGRTGMASFTYKTLDPGQSRHTFEACAQSGGKKSAKHYCQPVFAFQLDELVEKFRIAPPSHIKLDVDGGEVEVLKGAVKTLGHPGLRSILAEIDHTLTQPVLEILGSKGFVMKDKFQGYRPTGEPKPAWYGVFAR